MKKWSIALLVALLGAGFVACSEDKLENGSGCDKGDECKSGYCSDEKVCADKPEAEACKEDKTCDDTNKYCIEADNVCVDKKDADADCTADNECKSNKCDAESKKCVAVAPEENDCAATCTDTNKYCNGDGACVDKKDADADCTADNECKSGDCSDAGKCVAASTDPELPEDGSECDTPSIACNGKNLVECAEDAMAPGELAWKVTACADACLDLDDADPACYKACDEADKKTVKCDPDSGDDGDSLKASLELTCTVIGDGKYEIVTKRNECEGMYTCDTTTGLCETAGTSEPDKNLENGETCEKNSDCKSNYCDEATKKCTDKPSDKKANGEACTDANECESGYCNETCADMPVASGASCKTSAECTEQTEICGAEYTCIVAEGKAGLGDACTDDASCAAELACADNGKCVLSAVKEFNGQACTAEPAECFGVALVSCQEDQWNTDPETQSMVYVVEACAEKGNVCAKYENKSACYEPCTEADATKVLCDMDNVNGNDESLGKVTYTCKDVDGKLLFVPTKRENCDGSATCDMYDGTARCL